MQANMSPWTNVRTVVKIRALAKANPMKTHQTKLYMVAPFKYGASTKVCPED